MRVAHVHDGEHDSFADGRVRGIATGTTFRRLVATTLARLFSKDVEAACAPFQFALSMRAGVDSVGHAVRTATDVNPELTVLSIDGVGAYDHVFRSAMISKIWEVPALRPLLPFVRSVYARPASYVWTDDEGQRTSGRWRAGSRVTPQCRALFSFAIHNAVVRPSQR